MPFRILFSFGNFAKLIAFSIFFEGFILETSRMISYLSSSPSKDGDDDDAKLRNVSISRGEFRTTSSSTPYASNIAFLLYPELVNMVEFFIKLPYAYLTQFKRHFLSKSPFFRYALFFSILSVVAEFDDNDNLIPILRCLSRYALSSDCK
jgi:hypothetical protein